MSKIRHQRDARVSSNPEPLMFPAFWLARPGHDTTSSAGSMYQMPGIDLKSNTIFLRINFG
jgi:hypothetical protein